MAEGSLRENDMADPMAVDTEEQRHSRRMECDDMARRMVHELDALPQALMITTKRSPEEQQVIEMECESSQSSSCEVNSGCDRCCSKRLCCV